MPNASPHAVRTAGAICTTVTLSGAASAAKAFAVSSRSRSAPVGQWVMHWPQSEQSDSLIKRLPETSIVVREPEPLTSQTESDCTLSHTCTHRMHLMHLLVSRYRGKVVVQNAFLPRARSEG